MSAQPIPELHTELWPWYAIRTRSNHERTAASVLRGKGYDPYLPLYAQRRLRSHDAKTELPLFPGYVFCRFDAKNRLPILTSTGVVSIIGFGKELASVPDHEIEAIKAVLRSGFPAEPCEYLREGQQVRVADGSLQGLEGILVRKRNRYRMVVSVTMLQRSISVEIEADRLIPL